MPLTPCGMMRLYDKAEFEVADREETLQLLPNLSGARTLELGCGIGRFTGTLSLKASHVTCIELVPEFIELNRARHQKCTNIDFVVADVMDVAFEKSSFDFVFANWLLLYLSDDEVGILVSRIAIWLKSSGKVFFRETCSPTQIEPLPGNHAHYRPRGFYEQLFCHHFALLSTGIITCWLEVMHEPFSHYWLYKNVLPASALA